MTEEQKQITLGQVAEMKHNLEENIKNQLNDFMKQTGCHSLDINGWYAANRSLGENDTVVYDMDGSVTINLSNFLNN
jgi:hypothetical protein